MYTEQIIQLFSRLFTWLFVPIAHFVRPTMCTFAVVLLIVKLPCQRPTTGHQWIQSAFVKKFPCHVHTWESDFFDNDDVGSVELAYFVCSIQLDIFNFTTFDAYLFDCHFTVTFFFAYSLFKST